MWVGVLLCVGVVGVGVAGDLPLNLPSFGGGGGGRVSPLQCASCASFREDGSMLCICCVYWGGLVFSCGAWALVAVLTALLFPLTSSTLTLACLCLRLVVAVVAGRVECMYAISWSMFLRLCGIMTSSDGGWSAWGPSVGAFGCFLGLPGLRIWICVWRLRLSWVGDEASATDVSARLFCGLACFLTWGGR